MTKEIQTAWDAWDKVALTLSSIDSAEIHYGYPVCDDKTYESLCAREKETWAIYERLVQEKEKASQRGLSCQP